MNKVDLESSSSSASAKNSIPLVPSSSNSTNKESGSDVLEIIELWKQFDFCGAKGNMEKLCIEMRELKTCSINGRKRLNDMTKAFRSNASKSITLTDILKAYQEEIDQLSKRSKFSENAYFVIFKSLDQLPDPVPIIESLMSSVLGGSANSLEIERLKSELKQYDDEFQHLKNQDVTIRRLEDQLNDLRDNQNIKIQEEVNLRVGEIEQRCNQRIVAAESQCREERRLADRRVLIAQEAMQRAVDNADRAQTQLFEANLTSEQRHSALMAENALLAEGTHRLQIRMAEMQQQLSSLSPALTSSADDAAAELTGEGINMAFNTSKHSANLTLQMVVSELREELQRQSDLTRTEMLQRQKAEAMLRDVTANFNKEREAHSQVRVELSSRPSREEFADFKRQLRVLHRIAFNDNSGSGEEGALDESDNDGAREDSEEIIEDDSGRQRLGSPKSGGVVPKYNLEGLLVARLKVLESELAGSRRDLIEAREQEAAAKEAVKSLKKSLDSSTALIARLESELDSRADQLSGHRSSSFATSAQDKDRDQGRDSGIVAEGPVELAELLGVSVHADSNVAHVAASTAKHFVNTVNINISGGGVPEQGTNNPNLTFSKNGNSTQMVAILTSQRDRYKERLTQAENAMLRLQQLLDAAAASKASLEADNLTLYSKIRFLQSYQSKVSPDPRKAVLNSRSLEDGYGRSGEDSRENGSGLRPGPTDSDIEKKYHALYEQRMNPFAEFSEHEKRRKLTELSVADRIILNTTMAIVSHPAGRSFLLVYFGAMHFLVFVTLYYSIHRVHYGCDPNLDHLLK